MTAIIWKDGTATYKKGSTVVTEKLSETIFEIKKEMNAKGWSIITPERFESFAFFTKQFILDTLIKCTEEANKKLSSKFTMEGFDPAECDIILGNGTMYWESSEEEW